MTIAELVDLFGEGGRRGLAGAAALVVRRCHLHLVQHAAVSGDDERERLGTADVYADRHFSHARDSARAFNSRRA